MPLAKAAIVDAIRDFRDQAEAIGATSLHAARLGLPETHGATVDRVEVAVAEQPPGKDLASRPNALVTVDG